MKKVWTGLESSGKSLQLAITADNLLKRNIRWLKITGVPRTMAFDTPMSEKFVKKIKDAGLIYLHFDSLIEVMGLSQADIFINEIIKYFPQAGSNALSNEQMDFLTQGAKNGVDMYCASQDFSQAHKQFRLLVNEVSIVTKILGSRRPVKSAPPVNFIWGICMLRTVDPKSFRGESATMETNDFFPSFFFIEKEDCELFDTSFKVPLTELPPKYVRKQLIIGKDEKGEEVYKKEKWV